MHPVRLVIHKDSCLAFDPGDPTVRSVIADIASAIKIQQLEQVRPRPRPRPGRECPVLPRPLHPPQNLSVKH